jgi:hypothetical protein
MTNSKIADMTGRNLTTVQGVTSRLKKARRVVETGDKVDREAVLELAEEESG